MFWNVGMDFKRFVLSLYAHQFTLRISLCLNSLGTEEVPTNTSRFDF